MKIKNLYTLITFCITFMFLSCDSLENTFNNLTNSNKGNFVISKNVDNSIWITRGTDSCANSISSVGDMTVSLSEKEWDESSETRGNVTGDEYRWDDGACISLYMTKSTENKAVEGLIDVPFDPNTYKTYTLYRPYDDNEGHSGSNNEQTVNNTAFFFNSKSGINADNLKSEHLDFYGYAPRPYDRYSNNLYYKKTSIISLEAAHSHNAEDWSKLPYIFEDIQTDDNLSFHDIMCSLPENSSEDWYGNIGKTENDNVQLRFKHMFSLLNIEIDKGNVYDKDGLKDCNISEISISGSEISTEGTLDIQSCSTSKTNIDNAEIKRVFNGVSIKDKSLKTYMILQPTGDYEGMSDDEKNKRFIITCVVDNIPFKCSLPDIKLEAGKKYNLKLKLAPSAGLVFRVWNGAKVEMKDGSSIEAGEHEVFGSASSQSFKVSTTDNNTQILKVLCNGKDITNAENEYTLTNNEDSKVYCDIVTTPAVWYCTPNDMRIHFDAIWNNKYNSYSDNNYKDWENCNVWSDLSGNGNDGTLKSFDQTDESGWNNIGLCFDGINDIVTYPGNINHDTYTIELYLRVSLKNQKSFARMTAEGKEYPCYFIDQGNLALYAHGYQGVLYKIQESDNVDSDHITQFDFVYKSSDNSVNVYIDGRYKTTQHVSGQKAIPIPIASLGNRIQDNTRALRATYYSFIMYDTALDEEQIKQNYEINRNRFEK